MIYTEASRPSIPPANVDFMRCVHNMKKGVKVCALAFHISATVRATDMKEKAT